MKTTSEVSNNMLKREKYSALDKEDRKFYQGILEEYYKTRSKINHINEQILKYKIDSEEGKTCAEVLECQRKLVEDYKKRLELFGVLDTILNKLKPHYKKILDLRYEHNKSWEEVSLATYLSLKQCHNIKNYVLHSIKEKYEKR